ncbi:Membrane protein insertase YidC [Rosistilla carotiformis]|uniref:Membrane protein insertase YidC n=1 Tax=Rosistilla carotiformis TaxID=2528017 RepID=A0A518JYJ9_9BACT|nr:YidC/Oxa1 family insertase periplasmic-domain containing protein [Rosistilla carotiformis]QDV70614.1 Membrane protein insertase YidC [Rosistilla carotiformis]
MERRVLAYLFVSAFFMFVMMTMRPKQPPADDPNAPDVVAELDAEADEPADAEDLAEATDPAADGDAKTDDDAAPSERPRQKQWFTIGSLAYDSEDPTLGDKTLITLSNRGAGIERIELIERNAKGQFRYRRVDTRSGYLGYLAPSAPSEIDGCQINVIGPGTPADLAGLKVGDIIVATGTGVIVSPSDLDRWLEETSPGQTITLEVLRGSGESRETVTVEAKLTQHPLDLIRLAKSGGPDQVPGNISRLSCLLTLAKLNTTNLRVGQKELTKMPSLFDGLWNVTPIEDAENPGFEFRFPISASEAASVAKGSGALEVVRRYTVPAAGSGYDIDLQTEIVNKSEAEQEVAYRLEGPNGLTLEGWWYSAKISPNWTGGAGARDVVYNTAAEYHRLMGLPAIVKQVRQRTEDGVDKDEDVNETLFASSGDPKTNQLRYIGIDGQYFTASYLPLEGEAQTDVFSRGSTMLLADLKTLNPHQTQAANVSFYVDSTARKIAPGESLVDNLRLYAGPKRPEMLEERGLSRLIEYGLFGAVSKLLSGFLHFIYMILGNYGLAIILLTVCVRGAMFPLSRKAAQNAQKMQELAPEFKKIAEKYKDDMEKRLKAQQDLQKKHGFNPLSGCLPMFVQLPIFIGLYRSLSCDIELRQAAFIPGIQWCSNLAAPDMFYNWSPWMIEYFAGRGTGWFGPYFNILPLIVMVLFMAQQKMFMPPPTDEQQEITQKVMFFMTFIMGIFFFKVAAGLCIYFITSSLWGMAERILVKKTIKQSPGGGGLAIEGVGSDDGPGISGPLKSAPVQKNRPRTPPKKK